MDPADHILLTREVLDVGAISELVSSESCGGICFFVGTTRDNFDGKRVVSLEYEAYEPMAMKEMQAICTELRTRWDDIVNIAFYHRLGLVPVKEASIVIAVSSPHRQAALDATAYAVEQLKKRVPIWKKEKYDNNESEWKENAESKQMVGKRKKLDFEACEVQDQSIKSTSLVQIAAEESEIQRRIHCFIDKKREEIDINNIVDFTSSKQMQATAAHEHIDHDAVLSSTCARTHSVIVKQENSKGHLKVRRVENRIGPQTGLYYWEALDKLMSSDTKRYAINTKNEYVRKKSSPLQIPAALQERLVAIEEHIHLPPADTEHIYARLKSIENRILYLESISPEYRHFMTAAGDWLTSEQQLRMTTKGPSQCYVNRKTYTADELGTIIAQLQAPNESDKQVDTN